MLMTNSMLSSVYCLTPAVEDKAWRHLNIVFVKLCCLPNVGVTKLQLYMRGVKLGGMSAKEL